MQSGARSWCGERRLASMILEGENEKGIFLLKLLLVVQLLLVLLEGVQKLLTTYKYHVNKQLKA